MSKERLTENINVRLTKGEKNLLKQTRDVFYSKKSIGWVVRELIKHHQKQFERLFDRSASEEEIEKKYQESLKEAKNETI
jgi:3-methyladenine DNA glycosylase AlkD